MTYTIFRRWIPLAFLATALCGLVYLAVQQELRQSANDPQIQMAEDAAAQLATVSSTQNVIPTDPVNINDSLSSYLTVYDTSGNPVAGNGTLDGALPKLPSGVFANVLNAGEDRFTWQPQSGVRDAVVVVRIETKNPGFVMAGRSLREIEYRENQTQVEAGAIWFCTLVGLLILEIIFVFVEERASRKARPSR